MSVSNSLRAAVLGALVPAVLSLAPLAAHANTFTFTGQVPGGADPLGGAYTIGFFGGGLVNFSEGAGEQPDQTQQVLFNPLPGGLRNATSFTITETGTLDPIIPLASGFGNAFETFTPDSHILSDWNATENKAGTKITYTAGPGDALLAGERFSTFTTFAQADTLPPGFAYTVTWGGAVPEPATWALMITGLALAGGALRVAGRRGVAAA